MPDKLDQATKNRENIRKIQLRYMTGEIDRETAKQLAQPILDRINKSIVIKTKELNKKYNLNRKPALLDFVNAMRNRY
jgi:hypothetical protein